MKRSLVQASYFFAFFTRKKAKKMVVGDGCKNGGPFLVNKPSNAAF
jgi:hypothetical protein